MQNRLPGLEFDDLADQLGEGVDQDQDPQLAHAEERAATAR